ncbi:phosphoribosyltransferase [Photobacterium damselae subsp. piscicida]|uniref:phosphoribosyltransferase n=1 Tax=Photobacterium damselae TaxID=38293 RepID=UPI00031F5A85|nr:phosphoribosyltransferase [Photobacterium damselae]OLQ79306.1 phosphoribosyl transferase [Photobacterium damselae subsp. piscicida]TFZ58962.1 phosphoribosyltransferase [Photobacterium damselae subsp. piscicida]TJZ91322.1 phosphoribosyltransferase [Photobacterium damselae subsp. piscicida]
MAAKQLKGVILSVEDTIMNMGKIDATVFTEVEKLMAFFKLRGLKPVLLANKRRTITLNGSAPRDLYDYLDEHFPELTIFTRLRDPKIPFKKTKAATEYVLSEMGWESNEVVYIGSSHDDMITALHGSILFLRATWYSNKTDYGFEFSEPKEVARFIDTLCLREHFWSHEIIDGDFEYYALAPFSTSPYKPTFAKYSHNARAAAKFGQGDVDFWLGALVTSMYFTGIHKRIDFIAAYPGHSEGVDNDKMCGDLMTFGKCFNKGYLHDLIERHKTAIKSQTARINKIPIDHHNQLNTIKLNKLPTKNYKTVYKKAPVKKGKTVLLVDDICTAGWSLDAGRKYIEKTGAKTILVTWLKTINTNYCSIGDMDNFDPYEANTFAGIPMDKQYGYHEYHVDGVASEELGDHLELYLDWDWPA